MSRLNFRQGLVRFQTDSSGTATFLSKSGGGQYIDLIVSPDPTVFTIAHLDQNYLFAENTTVTQAWGPFNTAQDYWLYWDINLLNGQLTRNYTTVEPIFSLTPPAVSNFSPLPNGLFNATLQNWFDLTNMVWKVWTGNSWTEVLRCFAAEYQNGATVLPYPQGTQFSYLGKTSGIVAFAGYPLFDDANLPIQRFRKDRRGVFIHTEMPLASQWSRLANFRIEAAMLQGQATENIGMHHAIAYTGPNKIGLARNTVPSRPAIGVASEDISTGQVRMFIAEGFVEDETWDWDVHGSEPAGTPLFVGSTGQLTTIPPQSGSIQQIGVIVDAQIAYISPKQLIQYTTTPPNNTVPTALDKTSGRLIAKDLDNSTSLNAVGYIHQQTFPSTTWTITHNGLTEYALVQIFDSSKQEVKPDTVTITDENTVTVTFGSAQLGNAHVVLLQPT